MPLIKFAQKIKTRISCSIHNNNNNNNYYYYY